MTQLTKKQQYSVTRLHAAIETIEQLVPLERKRTSMKRRRALEDAHVIFCVHGPKLGLSVPDLSHFYYEEEFLDHARTIEEQLRKRGM